MSINALLEDIFPLYSKYLIFPLDVDLRGRSIIQGERHGLQSNSHDSSVSDMSCVIGANSLNPLDSTFLCEN